MTGYSYFDTRSGKTYCGMTGRKSIAGLIGNGLYVQVSRGESLLEAYKRTQRACKHEKRDRHGACYQCGHRMPEAA